VIEAYSDYLAEQKALLEKDLAGAAQKLRAKVQELMADKEPTPQGQAHGLVDV
jgi:hypothetical protein